MSKSAFKTTTFRSFVHEIGRRLFIEIEMVLLELRNSLLKIQ